MPEKVLTVVLIMSFGTEEYPFGSFFSSN